MKAYTKTISKAEFVRELKNHQQADDFIRGTYWNGEKGCAVGCSLESISRLKNLKLSDFSLHAQYEVHLGIPEWLARMEDTLFEGMDQKKSKSWPVEFAEAIPEGADLESVKVKFLVCVLEHTLVSMDRVKFDAQKWPSIEATLAESKKSR